MVKRQNRASTHDSFVPLCNIKALKGHQWQAWYSFQKPEMPNNATITQSVQHEIKEGTVYVDQIIAALSEPKQRLLWCVVVFHTSDPWLCFWKQKVWRLVISTLSNQAKICFEVETVLWHGMKIMEIPGDSHFLICYKWGFFEEYAQGNPFGGCGSSWTWNNLKLWSLR